MKGSKVLAIAIVGLMIGSASLFLISNHSEKPLIARAMTTSGDTYGGSGNWIVTNPTIYDGTNVAVHGNIYINSSGSLTIKSATLTMDEATPYQFAIYVNTGVFKASGATLSTSASATGAPYAKVDAAYGGYIRISNSTVNHFGIEMYGANNYIDNSTLHATYLKQKDVPAENTNISYNHFNGYTGIILMQIQAAHTTVTGNVIDSFNNLDNTFGCNILVQSGSEQKVIKNTFHNTTTIYGIIVFATTTYDISYNTFDHIASERTGSNAGILLGGQGAPLAGERGTITHNLFKTLSTTTAGKSSSFGIFAQDSVRNLTISYNTFWNVNKTRNHYASAAIVYDGRWGTITHNTIGNITGDVEDAYGLGVGIIAVGCSLFDDLYDEISYNTFTLLHNSSEGITVQSGSRVNITGNTFGIVRSPSGQVASVAISIYAASVHGSQDTNYVNVTANTFASLSMDSVAILISNWATYDWVTSNTVHISNSGSILAMGSAIIVSGESWSTGTSWSGDGSVIANNTITRDSGTSLYPDYSFWDCWKTTKGPNVKLIIAQAATIKYLNATINLVVISGISPVITDNKSLAITEVGRFGDYFSYTINRTYMPHLSPPTDYGWINVTGLTTPLLLTLTPQEAAIVILIPLFLLLGVAIRPVVWIVDMTKKKKLPTSGDVINQVIFILVGLALVVTVTLMI